MAMNLTAAEAPTDSPPREESQGGVGSWGHRNQRENKFTVRTESDVIRGRSR